MRRRSVALLSPLLTMVLASSSAFAQRRDAPAPEPPPPPADEEARRRIADLQREQRELTARLKQLEAQQQAQQQRAAAAAREKSAAIGELRERLDALQDERAAELEEQDAERRRLQLYGWLDVQYSRLFNDDENLNAHGYLNSNNVGVGHLNLIADAQLAEQWRALFELRFTFSPDGQVVDREIPGLLPYSRVSTLTGDQATGVGSYFWGGVVIERAVVEWAPRDWFRVSAGQFFTPYGIWNLDHGTPVLIAIRPPLLLSSEIFPSRQTGVQIGGKLFFGQEQLEYALTLSNGRMTIANVDLDGNKALGGRIALTTHRVGELTAAFSWYAGKFTDRKEVVDLGQPVEAPILPRVQTVLTEQADEISLGGDVQWNYHGFALKTELAYGAFAYVDPYRPTLIEAQALAIGADLAPMADFSAFSVFTLLAYQLPWIDLRPYFCIEWISPNDNLVEDNAAVFSIGLNYRPVPRVVLKAEYYYVFFYNDPTFSPARAELSRIERDISILSFQAAVSF